jgi:hypothetical protein
MYLETDTKQLQTRMSGFTTVVLIITKNTYTCNLVMFAVSPPVKALPYLQRQTQNVTRKKYSEFSNKLPSEI